MRHTTSSRVSRQIFILVALLLLAVADANATRLYELNLLREDPDFKIDPGWFSDAIIKGVKDDLRKMPEKRGLFQFEIASVTAQQGKLLAALEQMAQIEDSHVKQSPDFVEERAEIKSLLGFDSSAIEDMDRIEPKFQNWKTLWHRSLILSRAEKHEQAKLALQTAVAEAERFRNGDNYHTILLKSAKKRNVTALEPDPQKREQVLSMISALLGCTSAPATAESIKLLGLDEKSAEKQQGGVLLYRPASRNSPLRCVTMTPDGSQIDVIVHSAATAVSSDIVRTYFDAGTEQEIAPGGMGGCGPGTLVLYPRKQNSAISQFIFDGAAAPALNRFSISYRKTDSNKN